MEVRFCAESGSLPQEAALPKRVNTGSSRADVGKRKSRPRGRPFPIHGSLGCSLSRLLYLFHLAGLPRLVEPRVKGAVQPEDREPALARDRLHPVRLLTRRCFGAEVKVNRAVSIGDQLVTLVIPAGERLRSLQ